MGPGKCFWGGGGVGRVCEAVPWQSGTLLHLELILMYHRVCLTLETMWPG